MTQDKATRLIIDKGDAGEQLNIKKANEMAQRELNERAYPMVDKYNFEKWSRKAGTFTTDAGTAWTKNTIYGAVLDCTEKMDEAAIPSDGRILWIKNSFYKLLKQIPEFIANETIGKTTMTKGIVGDVDGMEVRKVPNSYLPTGVEFVITHKSAILAPLKLMDYKIHKDPMGVSGDVIEMRIMHDAFVIGAKAAGVCLGLNNSYQIVKPTLTNDTTNTNVNIASTTAGVDIWYTTDGSDPRYSDTVHKGTANSIKVTYATLNNSESGTTGKTIRACAVPNSNNTFFQSLVSDELAYA
jgi:hypothetical protein